MVNAYCASYARPPAAVTLDTDDTVDVVHGHQQLSLFNGFCQPSRRSTRVGWRARQLLSGLHDCERNLGGFGKTAAAGSGGNGLIVTAATTKQITQFAVLATQVCGSLIGFEAPHASDPALDALVVLFQPVVQVGARPMPDRASERRVDSPGIGPKAVRRHPVRWEAGGRFYRAEKGLGGFHVAVLAQPGVDQVSISIDGTIQVDPFTPDLEVGLVHVPTDARTPPLPASALAERLAHDRQRHCHAN